MSVYNGEQYLQDAIESVLNQTFYNFEFLIIDDASNDLTPEIISGNQDPRIKVIRNSKNLGLTKSLNIGLGLAAGEYIARMDADDISLPERLERQVAFLDQHPEITIVGTAKQLIDQHGDILGTYIPLLRPQYRDFLKTNQITHGSVMIRRKILVAYSGYNETFRRSQDYALWLKMSKKQKIYNIPDVLYNLRAHVKSVSRSGEESIYYHILAIRMAKSSISEDVIEEIHKSGIMCLSKYFTRSDWVYYHSSIAGHYRLDDDLKGARREYWKIFYIEPWNVLNIVNLIRVYLGKNVINVTGRFYLFFKNYLRTTH